MVDGGRRHHPRRRHRWRHLRPDDLRVWREKSTLTREQVGEILKVHASTVSAWERNEWAPPPSTQRRLRSLIGSRPLLAPQARTQPPRQAEERAALRSLLATPGYDELRGSEGADMAVAIETTRPSETGDDELGIRRRVQSVVAQVQAREVRLPEVWKECRWGVHDGIAVIQSKRVGGMMYFFDVATGTFYRTHAPDSNRIQADSPRQVIAQDRDWLYPLLDKIPGGKLVIRRYHQQPQTPAPAREEKPVTVPVTTPPPPPTAADRALLDIRPVETKRVVMIEATKHVELAPHQIHALIRKAGREVPDAAEVKAFAPAGFLVEWRTNVAKKETRYFDEERSGAERLTVSPPQLAAMLLLANMNVTEKPEVSLTPHGYVRVQWKENKTEESG